MQITIDTATPLSDLDNLILQTLTSGKAIVGELAAVTTPPTKPAPKAAPAKPTPKAEPVVEEEAKPTPKAEPVVEEEPAEEPDEDLVGAPEPAPTAAPKVTLEDCVKLATRLVADGNAPKVKEALAEVNAKRVSEVTGVANIKKLHAALVAIDEG